jgi:hypothetical protein
MKCLPTTTLYRKITTNEAINVLQADQPPKLNLSGIPIKSEEGAYSFLFDKVVYSTISNM